MAAQNFETCLQLTLQYEGGYVDHPADPGGAANLGITRRTLAAFRGRPVSKDQVRRLTRAEAAQIYRCNYWDAVRCDELPSGVDAAVFDHAVNSGPRSAAKALQHALGLKADGVVGRSTLAALGHADSMTVVRALAQKRRGFLARLRTFKVFGRGWTRRVNAIEAASLALAKQSAAKEKVHEREQ